MPEVEVPLEIQLFHARESLRLHQEAFSTMAGIDARIQIELAQMITELVEMLGRKRRKKNAERLREFQKILIGHGNVQ